MDYFADLDPNNRDSLDATEVEIPGDKTVARWSELRRRVVEAPSVLRGTLRLLTRGAGVTLAALAGGSGLVAGAVALLKRAYLMELLNMGTLLVLLAGGLVCGALVVLLCIAVAERWQRKGVEETLAQIERKQREEEAEAARLLRVEWPAWRSLRVMLRRAAVSKAGPLRVGLVICNTSPRTWCVKAVQLRHLVEADGELRTVETDDKFDFGVPDFVLAPGQILEVTGKDRVRGGDAASVTRLALGRQMLSGIPGLLTVIDADGDQHNIALFRPGEHGRDVRSERDYQWWCHDLPVRPQDGAEV